MNTVDNFYLAKEIGSGQYGTVYLCEICKEENIKSDTPKRIRKGRRIACKMIKHKAMRMGKRMKKYLIQEIEIMTNTNHPNIIRFLEAKETKNNIYIFMEFCNGRDLSTLLELKGGKLGENLVRKIIKQVVSGLQYLNGKGIMHRDLKLDIEGKGSVSDAYIKEFDHEKEDIEILC